MDKRFFVKVTNVSTYNKVYRNFDTVEGCKAFYGLYPVGYTAIIGDRQTSKTIWTNSGAGWVGCKAYTDLYNLAISRYRREKPYKELTKEFASSIWYSICGILDRDGEARAREYVISAELMD